MKAFPTLAAASLTATAALLALLFHHLFSGMAPPELPPIQSEAAPAITPPTAEIAAGAWGELESDDSAGQVARLRAEGFPPSVIRAIMTAHVRERFAPRRKQLEAAAGDTPFWLAGRDPQREAAQRALIREEQKALQDLLGSDPENGRAASFRRMLPDIPADKVELLAQIQERYNHMQSDLYAATGGSMLPEDAEKRAALEKAMRTEVAEVLTPAEFEDYELRASRTAMQLRYTLTAFGPTEQEYRSLFKLQSAFDEEFGRMQPGMSAEQRRARSEGQQRLNMEIGAALGAERYAEYRRAIDFNYRRTTEVVERLSLPREIANEIYALQQSTQQQLTELRRPGAAATNRTAQLNALAAETEIKLRAALGDAGFNVYKQHAGSWVTSIAPRPAPAPKP